jgi:hypothetical protein
MAGSVENSAGRLLPRRRGDYSLAQSIAAPQQEHGGLVAM